MKRGYGFLMASGLLISIGIAAYADMGRPKTSPAEPIKLASTTLIATGLTITPDSSSYDARLQISQATFEQLKRAINEHPGSQTTSSVITDSSPRTILAGISLFFALSIGGLWLVRSNSSRTQKTIAAALIGAAVFMAAAVVTQGNGAPPALRWRGLSQNLNEGRSTTGSLTIEVVPQGNGMKLILPVQPSKKPKGGE